VWAPPDGTRASLLIFRKILNYGKTKKSTHGHTTAKPLRTHAYPVPAMHQTATERALEGPLGGILHIYLPYTYPTPDNCRK